MELCQSASFMDHPVLYSREDCRQGIQGLGRGETLAKDQQDGVISCDRTHQGFRRMMVQDIGQCWRQTYLGTDEPYLPGKLDALDAGRESVAVTLSQIGNVGGQPFRDWYQGRIFYLKHIGVGYKLQHAFWKRQKH